MAVPIDPKCVMILTDVIYYPEVLDTIKKWVLHKNIVYAIFNVNTNKNGIYQYYDGEGSYEINNGKIRN